MNGSRLLEVYPAVPLNPATRLSVVISYDGRVFFGLLADARLSGRRRRRGRARGSA